MEEENSLAVSFASGKNGEPDEKTLNKHEEKLKNKDSIVSQIVEDNLKEPLADSLGK